MVFGPMLVCGARLIFELGRGVVQDMDGPSTPDLMATDADGASSEAQPAVPWPRAAPPASC